MITKIKVNDDLVQSVQEKHYAAEAAKSVITTMLEVHAADRNTSIIDSAVFQEYQKQYQQKFRDFEEEKNKMYMESVDAVTREKVERWNLDYLSGTLTLVLKGK